MNYKSDFYNPLLHIRIVTNDKRVMRLMHAFLDFKECPVMPHRRKIFIKFYIHKSRGQKKNSPPANFSVSNNLDVVRSYVFKIAGVKRSVILEYTFVQPLHYILHRKGYHFFHNAVLAKNRTLYFISGLANSGKSIIALNLRENKFCLLADDKCFVKIHSGAVRIIPFPTKAGISKKNLKKYSHLKEESRKNPPWHGKLRVSLSDGFQASETRPKRIILLFPKYSKKRNVSLERISRQRALYLLAYVNIHLHKNEEYLKKCESKFAALSEFISKTEPFLLSYNDENVHKIASFLEKGAPVSRALIG